MRDFAFIAVMTLLVISALTNLALLYLSRRLRTEIDDLQRHYNLPERQPLRAADVGRLVVDTMVPLCRIGFLIGVGLFAVDQLSERYPSLTTIGSWNTASVKALVTLCFVFAGTYDIYHWWRQRT